MRLVMRRTTLRVLLSCVFAVVFAALTAPANADPNYPNRPVRIVVPSSPGGGTDILARVLADHLARALNGQFFVENRPGAGQSIGTEIVARAPNDGYTLLMAASTLALNPVMFKNIRYDAVKDFAPITQVAFLPNALLVHPSLGVSSLRELIALAKRKPGELTYASAGLGTSPHMGIELLKHMAGIELRHIPFRGSGPAVAETLSGRVPITLASTLQSKPLIEGGQLKALAVTSPKRAEGLPDVPTVAEAGPLPGYEALQWYGLLAPAGTPSEIVARLRNEVAAALKLPDVKVRLVNDGAEAAGSTPAEFAKLIKDELEKWAAVAKAANIQPE
jgi:tripartite-type tricarboxylate transporter receptor subunit TctC